MKDKTFSQRTWTQENVEYVIKDIPGEERFGVLAPEILESIKTGTSGVTAKMIKAIQSGDYSEMRKTPPPNTDITDVPIKQWEFAVNREGYDIMVTACCKEDVYALEKKPAIIYFHGGGWCMGSRNNVQNPLRYLAQLSGSVVFNVGYRLAPEHRYPVANDDCYEVVKYVYSHAEAFKLDRNNICVSGDSAGGNIACSCAHRDRNQKTGMIKSQVLIYPVVAQDNPQGTDDYHFSLSDYDYDDIHATWIVPSIKAILSSLALRRYIYVKDNKQARLSDASPLYDSDFSNLPDTLIICAEYDFLTQQCKTYARKLAKGGSNVRFITYRGTNHGFMTRLGRYPQSQDLIKEITQFLY